MKLFRPAPITLEHRRSVDAALEDAFAPLRARTTSVGPARVRAAVRWTPERSKPGALELLARASQLTVAAAFSAFLFAGSVASVTAVPTTPDISRDAVRVDEWMLNGRNALQRPMGSRATDFRTTAGDFAANAATARRPAPAAPAQPVRDTEPFAGRP